MARTDQFTSKDLVSSMDTSRVTI